MTLAKWIRMKLPRSQKKVTKANKGIQGVGQCITIKFERISMKRNPSKGILGHEVRRGRVVSELPTRPAGFSIWTRRAGPGPALAS